MPTWMFTAKERGVRHVNRTSGLQFQQHGATPAATQGASTVPHSDVSLQEPSFGTDDPRPVASSRRFWKVGYVGVSIVVTQPAPESTTRTVTSNTDPGASSTTSSPPPVGKEEDILSQRSSHGADSEGTSWRRGDESLETIDEELKAEDVEKEEEEKQEEEKEEEEEQWSEETRGLAVPLQKRPHPGQWPLVLLGPVRFKLARGLDGQPTGLFSGLGTPPPNPRGSQHSLPRPFGRHSCSWGGSTRSSTRDHAAPEGFVRRSPRIRSQKDEKEEEAKWREEHVRRESNRRRRAARNQEDPQKSHGKPLAVTTMLRSTDGRDSWLNSEQIAAYVDAITPEDGSMVWYDGEACLRQDARTTVEAIRGLLQSAKDVVTVVCFGQHWTALRISEGSILHYDPAQQGVPEEVTEMLADLQTPIRSLTSEEHRVPVQRDDINCGILSLQMVEAWFEGRRLTESNEDLRLVRRRMVRRIADKRRVTYRNTVLTKKEIEEWNTWTRVAYESKKKRKEEQEDLDEDPTDSSSRKLEYESPLEWSRDSSRAPTPAPSSSSQQQQPCPSDEGHKKMSPTLLNGQHVNEKLGEKLGINTPSGVTSFSQSASSRATPKRTLMETDDEETKKQKLDRYFVIQNFYQARRVLRAGVIANILFSLGAGRYEPADICKTDLVRTLLQDGGVNHIFEFTRQEVSFRCNEALLDEEQVEKMFKRFEEDAEFFHPLPEKKMATLISFLLILIRSIPSLCTLSNFSAVIRCDLSSCSAMLRDAGREAVLAALQKFSRKGKECLIYYFKYDLQYDLN